MSGTQTPHPEQERTRRRTTDAERAIRNERIVALRAVGMAWRQIADEVGLSYSQVRQIVANHVAAGRAVELDLRDLDPHALLADVVNELRDSLRQLRVICATPDNDSAAVGAIRTRADVTERLFRVLGVAGLLPPTPQAWQDDRYLAQVSQGIADAVHRLERQLWTLPASAGVQGVLRGAVQEFENSLAEAMEHEPLQLDAVNFEEVADAA